MKRISPLHLACVFVVTAFLPIFGEAQTLEGHIRDSRTHIGLPEVKLELLHLGIRVGLQYSNSEGEFLFANLAPLDYTLSATLSGYDTVSIAVDAARQSQIYLELKHAAEQVQRVAPT